MELNFCLIEIISKILNNGNDMYIDKIGKFIFKKILKNDDWSIS